MAISGIEQVVLLKHYKSDELSLCYSDTVPISKMSICLWIGKFWIIDVSTKEVTNSINSKNFKIALFVKICKP